MLETDKNVEQISLSIIIPVYNERDNIIPLLEEIIAVMDRLRSTYEVLFIDDGSKDDTWDVLNAICKKNEKVKTIRLRRNSGQSAAMRAGFDHASGDYLVTMDGDLQNDPADIPRLIKAIDEDYDAVCGWRANRQDSTGKKIFSRFSNTLRQILLKDNLHDYGCTLRIYKRNCVEDMELYGEMHRYIPALMNNRGFKVGELPVNHRKRHAGTSKYNWKRLMKGLSDLLVIAFWSRFAYRPMHIFGTSGIIICAGGFLVTAYLIAERLLLNSPLYDRPLFILSLLSIVIGLQFIVFGVMTDIMLRAYYGQNNIKNYRVEQTLNLKSWR